MVVNLISDTIAIVFYFMFSCLHDLAPTNVDSIFQIACVQHFSTEPLSFLLGWLLVKEDSKVAYTKNLSPLCGYYVYDVTH